MAITLDGTTGVTTPDLTVDTSTLKVDAANNRVGVGTASPTQLVDIAHSGSQVAGAVRIGDPSSISSNTGIYMRTTGLATIGAAGGTIVFDTNFGSSEKVRIDSDGLKFNGDTAAANALDDYEEGTFTPSFTGGLTGSSYGDQNGTYVKIGQLVFFAIELDITNGQASTNGNQIKIDNIPFVSAAASPMIYGQGGAWVIFNNNFYNVDTGIYLQIPTNTNQIRLYRGSGNGLVGTDSGVNGQNDLHIAGCYRTA